MDAESLDAALAAARTGASWALTVLFRTYQPGLLRYLGAKVGDDREDVASEVWIDAARGLHTFTGDANAFRAWLFTIARRRAIDHGRRRLRRSQAPGGREAAADRASADDTERDALDAAAGDDAVRELVAALPEAQAEVILLRVVAGLSVDEVATLVGRSPAAVSVLQHRGLARLARHLDRSVGD